MPTIALSNTVAFGTLTRANLDFVKAFPPIRTLGTIGFIASMWLVNSFSFGLEFSAQQTYMQLIISGVLSVVLGLYSFTLPACPISAGGEKKSLVQRLGLDAFVLFKSKQMAMFFIFSMLLGVSLQITNGFANGFITSFKNLPEFANTFGANHANALISLSQVSETLCILLIPICLKRLGIKWVMLIAMFAWVLRFGLFGLGNPGDGLWMFILSMIVYGVAFDFFNISGSLFVNENTSGEMRSSAQGLFMIMTNGIGATVGTLSAQAVVNRFVPAAVENADKVVLNGNAIAEGWSDTWLIFAGYALVVALLFWALFKYKHNPDKMVDIKH
jgi:NHS family xanthosine MFS transporter